MRFYQILRLASQLLVRPQKFRGLHLDPARHHVEIVFHFPDFIRSDLSEAESQIPSPERFRPLAQRQKRFPHRTPDQRRNQKNKEKRGQKKHRTQTPQHRKKGKNAPLPLRYFFHQTAERVLKTIRTSSQRAGQKHRVRTEFLFRSRIPKRLLPRRCAGNKCHVRMTGKTG